MSNHVDIPAVQASTVTRTMRGKLVAIDDDAQGIARELAEIDESLKLAYSPDEDLWIVRQEVAQPDGSVEERFVTAMHTPIDKRLVHRVHQITSGSYDVVAELEAEDARRDRENDWRRREQVGPVAERLAHALRKDLQIKNRAFIGGR